MAIRQLPGAIGQQLRRNYGVSAPLSDCLAALMEKFERESSEKEDSTEVHGARERH
jgi:hypothetical protein